MGTERGGRSAAAPPAERGWSGPARRLQRTWWQSLAAAWAGLAGAWLGGRNMRFHWAAGYGVAWLALWSGIGAGRTALLLAGVALVMVTEMLNTAIEAVVDLATPDYQPLARRAKDVAAGAVLLAAGFSLALGALTLLPVWPQALETLLDRLGERGLWAALTAVPGLILLALVPRAGRRR